MAQPMKVVDGRSYPASAFLVVEDSEKPSTWHLRVRGTDGKPDHRLMGAAWAALHGGYRGNKYEGPGKQEALAKLRRLYASEDMDTPKMKSQWYTHICPECVRKEGPMWRLTMDAFFEESCLLCGNPTKALHELGAVPDWLLKDEDHDAPADDQQAADDTPEDEDAGPDIPPTSERLAMIAELEELLEVE